MSTKADVSSVLRAIESALERMIPLKGVDLACAAVEEMKRIILAKDAYDEAVADAQTKRVLDRVFPNGVPQ